MSADGCAPAPLVELRHKVSAEGYARLEAVSRATGRTIEQIAGQAIRAELERLEAVAAFARAASIDLTAPERPKLPDARASTSTFVSPTTGAPTLPDVPDLLSTPTP